MHKSHIFSNSNIIEFIAKVSDGGLRDAINLLDQATSLNKKKITRTDVLNLVGSIEDGLKFKERVGENCLLKIK